MKKRIFAAVMMLAILIGQLPTVALAAEEPTKVAVLLVDGQSNAAGTAGTLDGVAPEVPEEGTAYIWNRNTEELVDLNAYVAGQMTEERTASIGFHPALAKEWYEKTGETVVIIHLGFSGSNILGWADYQGNLTDRTTGNAQLVKDCIAAIEADSTMEIVRAGYFWLQGESDACINSISTAPQCIYSTADQYYTAYKAVHDAYVAALETSGQDAFGGILAVRTRQALLESYNIPDEYCGVRVAQQELANQNADIYMASVITEDWTVSSNAGMFATSGGPIHYSQAGYNALGADAAANMAAAVAGETPVAVESIQLFGEDGETVYAAGDTIYVMANTRTVGELNTSETGAAQIVAQPLPITAACDSVTMTLTDSEGNTVTGVIDNKGYIADVYKITEPLTLTVTAGEVSQTYTLAPRPQYAWSFTDTSLVDGSVLNSVTGDGWTENDLTYTKDFVLDSNGMNNSHSTNARGYFVMDEAVFLPKDEAWTIRWQGSLGSSSTVLGNTEGGTLGTVQDLIYCPSGDKVNLQVAGAVQTGSSTLVSGAKSSANTVYILTHDGYGNLTIAYTYDGTTYVEKKANAIKKDYTFDTVLGYYLQTSTTFNYYGTIKSMEITRDYVIVGEQTVELEAPVATRRPQTTVTGENFTGTVTWEPELVDGRFDSKTAYTAYVALTPADGYRFDSNVTVLLNGAEIKPSVSASGDMLDFEATFPETEEIEKITAVDVALAVTQKGAAPAASVAGEGYTGTVTWTPGDEAFAFDTEYTAAVTLTADNGSIFDANAVVTVEGAEISNVVVTTTEDGSTLTFDVKFAALAPAVADTTNNFYWDFTDTTAASGNIISAVESDGWTANDLAASTTADVTLSANGLASGRYYTMATPVTLSKSEPWTIQWQGSITTSSSVISNTEGGTLATNTALVYVAGNGADKYTMHLKVGGADQAALSQTTQAIPDAVRIKTDTVWTLTHDGAGNLTIAWTTADGVTTAYVKANAIKKDYTFDTIMGYFQSGTKILYGGSMKYMKLVREYTVFGEQAVVIEAPAAMSAPQTAITADRYTGEIVWTPAVNGFFEGETAYTAAVTLTAAEGNFIAPTVTVTVDGAEVSDFAVSADGKTITFAAAFPATAEVVYLESATAAIPAPKRAAVPAAAITGEHYTGTVTWTPGDALFVLDTEYTATVTLTADSGCFFTAAPAITVPGAEVSDVTVNAARTQVTFTAAFAAPTAGEALTTGEFYWDFTNTGALNGNVLTSVTGNGWTANDLVFNNTAPATTENGMVTTATANGRGYFLMDHAVVLSKTEPWTVEWQGSMTASSTVLGNTADGTLDTVKELIYVANNAGTADKTQMFLKNVSGSPTFSYITDAAKQSADTVWYIIHDGSGNLTMGYRTGEDVVLKNFTLKQDLTFDTVLGYYLKSSTSFNYYGTVQYVKILREAVDPYEYIDSVTAEITAPKRGETPVTAPITGENYSGEFVWNTTDEVYAPETVYTASVELIVTSNLHKFPADLTVTVPGAQVTGLTVAADGKSATFTAVFPATSPDYGTNNFYWDFTNTAAAEGNKVSSVADEKWSANGLTYTKGDVTLTEDGMDNYAHDRGYFLMDTPVVLAQDQAWTIEWKGSMPMTSTVLANVDADAGTRSEYIFAANGTGKTDATALMFHNSKGVQRAALTAIPDAVKQSTDTVWYINHNGEGDLTLAYKDGNGVTVTLKKGLIDQDYTFNAIMGYVVSTSKYHNYGGVMEYLKIYTYDALAVEELALTAPVTGETLQTTIPTDGRYTASVEWDPADATVAEAQTIYTATITLTAADGYTFSGNTMPFVRGAKISTITVAEDGSTVTLYAKFAQTNKAADTDSNFYWDFTNVDAVNGNVVSAVEDEQFTQNDLTYSKDSVPMSESGLTNGGSSHGYFRLDTPVYLPVDEQWTIEWKGGTDSSSILMANNTSNLQDAHIDSNGSGHKTSEFIYIYNNYAATQPDNNYVTISMGCTALAGESAAGFGGISKAQRTGKDSVWYLINDAGGDLRLEYWAEGSTEADLVVNRNNDLLRKDCTFDSLLGYFTEQMPINYSGNLQYVKIYREELMNQVELAVEVNEPALETSFFSADILWDTMTPMSARSMVTDTTYAYATATLTAKEGYRFSDRMEIVIPGAVYTEINEISADGKTAVVTAVFEITRQYLLGDINADGAVTAVDSIILARCLAGWTGYEEMIPAVAVADIDGNGVIEAADSIILARYLAGWGPDYDKYFTGNN